MNQPELTLDAPAQTTNVTAQSTTGTLLARSREMPSVASGTVGGASAGASTPCQNPGCPHHIVPADASDERCPDCGHAIRDEEVMCNDAGLHGPDTATGASHKRPAKAPASLPVHILSLGAGVQSSAMALMAACGEITPMPIAGVFADTGDEPLGVYLWISHLRELLPFPIYTVQSHHGKLSNNLTKGDHSQIPAYFLTADGTPTIGKRQCTNHWKVRPVRKQCRQLSAGGPVILWQGISTDEVSRCKDSGAIWITHRFPLIEASLNRRECVEWLKRHNYPEPPKSACSYCPYRSDAQWRKSRQDPMEWALIKRVDAMLVKRGEFLHSSCKPIADVDFSTEEDRGQLNMFNNECEGMCGV